MKAKVTKLQITSYIFEMATSFTLVNIHRVSTDASLPSNYCIRGEASKPMWGDTSTLTW